MGMSDLEADNYRSSVILKNKISNDAITRISLKIRKVKCKRMVEEIVISKSLYRICMFLIYVISIYMYLSTNLYECKKTGFNQYFSRLYKNKNAIFILYKLN